MSFVLVALKVALKVHVQLKCCVSIVGERFCVNIYKGLHSGNNIEAHPAESDIQFHFSQDLPVNGQRGALTSMQVDCSS